MCQLLACYMITCYEFFVIGGPVIVISENYTNVDSTQTTASIRHSQYTRAERSWWYALCWVVVGVAATLYLADPNISKPKVVESVLLGVSALAPVMETLCRHRFAIYSARADLCRRAVLYQETLGIGLSFAEQRIIALWGADTPLSTITQVRPYFSSVESFGPGRLADAICESAFFTSELARRMASGGFCLASVCTLALISTVSATTNLSLQAETLNRLQGVLGVLAIAVQMLLIAEVFFTSLAYRALQIESMAIFQSAEQLRQRAELTEIAAIRLAESYSIALVANLPIPNFLYKWQHDRIDRAYRLR